MSAVAGTVVDLEDVAVTLGGRPVLRGVDLHVQAGEVVAILGANGSGKSTLVRTMLGLLQARRGSVTLFGTPLADLVDRHRVGYVPQRTTATAGVPASVWEVVCAGRLARRRAWQPMRAADRRAVRAALEAVDLADRARDGVATLSGGQQQRVLIARALAGEPDLLVLDEPTAGVDLAHQQVFADLLTTLTQRGLTVVLVAHELGPLAPLITRSVVMRDGRVAYDGPPVEAFTDVHAHHHPVATPVDHHPQLRTAFDDRQRGRTR
ncbi:metal ABC transporter ATP-binding protein [Nocardioides marmoribigeumensis]|uniref:Zinc transport system ATP-binding protein n=1 Tax=Nocardioides marmoribigeumensis TaxID=433649 RepID=A0ABU2BQD9_9ACTN|nr:ABC transporter ATP-binding protein [Nocardioides marmoribigeumensis]MDR7360863.1 zinc transport system ATP-binding protein [Nocardioides marmoribigeumensis]